MDLLPILDLGVHISKVSSVSFFSAITIAVWVSELSSGDRDLLSLFYVVEVSVSSAS